MEDFSEAFGAKMKALRGQRSMEEFSKVLGLKTAATYFNYEKGRVPKPKILMQIALALNMTPAELLSPERKDVQTNTPVALPELGFRKVPVVSWARAGEAISYHDLCEQLEQWAMTQSSDPNSFGLIIEGNSMEPEIKAGDLAVFAPNRMPRNGELVVARLEESGGVYFKRFYIWGKEGSQVKLVSANPDYADIVRDRKDFRFIYPCTNIVRNNP
jgi:SOS-response transcriptional repressor LexA